MGISKTYQLDRRYAVRFTFSGQELECEWSPAMPNQSRGRKLLPAYRAARDDFLTSLTPFAGRIMVVDL